MKSAEKGCGLVDQNIKMKAMNKRLRITGSLCILVMIVWQLSSCKDDPPFVKPKLSFTSETLTVSESDETAEIEVTLDKAYTEDITIDYKIAGTALDEVAAGSNQQPDYKVEGEYKKLEIAKGDLTGKITLTLYSDFNIEEDETIILTIDKVDNENIEITGDDVVTITLLQEDGLLAILEWDESYSDVDMDMFLWYGSALNSMSITGVASLRASYDPPEFIFIPDVVEDGFLGMSYNYYEGTEDPMEFSVTFLKIESGEDVWEKDFTQQYTLANINAWDSGDLDPILVQTFKKAGGNYTNFSDITVPPSGSRVSHGKLPPGLVRK